MKAVITPVFLALSACMTFAACAGRLPAEEGVYQVNGTNSEHSRLRYLDGHVSANETCMIRVENALNPKIPPMYVNGRPMGFC